MKDVAILTKYYRNYNYGGMLQGYALYSVIKNMGYSVDIISYDVRKNANSVYPSIIQQTKQYGIGAAIPKVAEKVIAKGKYFIKDILEERIRLFEEFEADVGADTNLYDDDSINNLKSEYKVFISGSDQIWNPNAVRNLYLQTFVSQPYRKISYAASIGRDEFSDYEAKVMIPAISGFGTIGVREKTAKELLEKYLSQTVSTVLDPTLLLPVEEWEKISAKRLVEKKYALVYFFSDSLEVRKKAQNFCEQRGLELVVIPYAKQEYNLSDSKGPGNRINEVGPREFVSLIKNAEFVFTDSFHGAVFSLIHQVPFAVFERNKSGHVSMNSRLYDLLDLFEEKGRLVSVSDFDRVEELSSINAEKIKMILSDNRTISLEFLIESIRSGIQQYDENESIKTVSGKENECTGCGECAAFCPRNSIALERNANGFMVSVINTKSCIQCGLCKKVCPVLNTAEKHTPIEVYGAHTQMEMIKSASGGLAYSIARKVIEVGGIVYGAAYDENLKVKIIRENSVDGLSKIQGTKYVQADMTGVIEKVLTDLENHYLVLFTGTPCEVAGVVDAARRKKLQDNLLSVEIICHGTPSQQMFDDYLKWAERHYHSGIKAYAFRAKRSDKDKDFMVGIELKNGNKLRVSGFKDPYYKAFMSTKWFRESCYSCPFAEKKRVADLTLGDFWNAEELSTKFGKNRRISVVLANTEKGMNCLHSIQDEVKTEKTSWKTAAQGNANLFRPTRKFAGYIGYGNAKETFFDDEYKAGINMKKYIINQLPISVRRTVKKVGKKRGEI